MYKKLTYLLLTTVIVPSVVMACADVPSAEVQMKLYAQNGSEYATFEDYARVNFGLSEYTQLMGFQRIDNNEDGKIDIEEIQADIDSYYMGCVAMQTF
jgi:hypothetical protein